MKTLIVCTSVSHGNTRRIAEVLAEVLDARVAEPEQLDPTELTAYDLVGFGSGIYYLDLHPRLRHFVRSLPRQQRRPAFAFATSGLPQPPFRPYLRRFARLLDHKGFPVLDTFSCRGFDTWWPLKVVGGIHKGRPNATDLAAARGFAEGLRSRIDAH